MKAVNVVREFNNFAKAHLVGGLSKRTSGLQGLGFRV